MSKDTNLDKVKACKTLAFNDKDGEVRVGLLDAVVEHPDEHVGVLRKIHHELLMLLHLQPAHAARVILTLTA